MGYLTRIAVIILVMIGFSPLSAAPQKTVVGVWLVQQEGAPFPMHMYVFSADGTVHQANSDAGNPRTSDSDGKGIWTLRGGKIVGKWVQLSADRATHKYTGRGELSFELVLAGDRLTGHSSFVGLDANGKPAYRPISVFFDETRITLP